MNVSAKYLDLLQEKTETGTDYAVGKLLNESRSRLSGYRTGRNKFDEDMCFKVADALGVDPMEVIAAIKLEQCYEKEETEKAGFWSKTLKNTSTSLAAGFLALAMTLPGKVEADQFNITSFTTAFNNNIYYAAFFAFFLPLLLCHFIINLFPQKTKGYLNPPDILPIPAYV